MACARAVASALGGARGDARRHHRGGGGRWQRLDDRPRARAGLYLAAITAPLMAGPDAHPDPTRRWVAPIAGGAIYVALGLSAGVATALVATAPPILIIAVK